MKIQLVPMTIEHYVEAASISRLPVWHDLADTARQHIAAGPAFAGFRDGVLVGVAGVALLSPGVGEGWAILTPAGRIPMVHRVVVRMLHEIIITHRIHRFQARVLRDFYAGRVWAHRLGMRREATTRWVGPNREDFVQYVRLIP